MKSTASILAFACLGTATAAFSGASVVVTSEDVGESPGSIGADVTVGTALVATDKIVITADKAVWAAAGATTCAIDGTSQTATGSVDATKKILTLTMTSNLLAAATKISCTTNLGANPAAGAVAYTIASFAADGTTVKDASIALGTYTTYAYPTAIVKQEWTDNTCTTEKADDIYKYIIKEARLVGVCGVSTQSSFPTSATGGVYGTYSGLTCGAGTWTVSETFSYSTTAAKNCVTKSGKFYTYKTVFADETVTKVGVDLDVLNPITCAAPYWQKTPLTGVCTEVTVLGSQFGNVKFLPLAAGDLATGGMSASKSVMYIKFANGDTTCATTVSMAWGGVYGTTGCADISGPPTENWKFCENAACPAYTMFATSAKLGVCAAGAVIAAATLLA